MKTKILFTLLFIEIAVTVFSQTRPLYVPNVSNTPAAGDFPIFDSSTWITRATKDGRTFNALTSASVTNTASVLVPTQQTNYLVALWPNGYKYFLYTANTNVNITFTNLTAGNGASVYINAITSSISATIRLPASLQTNLNYSPIVTNGLASWHNYESIDGSSSNISVISGGFQRR